MTVRVDYRCGACGSVMELIVSRPIETDTQCACCGATATRQFGAFSAIRSRSAEPNRDRSMARSTCLSDRDTPLTCALDRREAEALAASLAGDNRKLDAIQADHERRQRNGLIDPTA